MSESMSSPWIRDYLVSVAETHGAQLYNVPVSTRKKKVQLTDFLTYQDDSYVWAWVSDKDYRVSVRISKIAADQYKSKLHRNVIDCRFFLIFISRYRPILSPRPLDPNSLGNTSVSHISLEVDHVSSVGIGAHLFGSPRDVESDESVKEWVLGLRQDGGGGNVLKLRNQQKLVHDNKVPSPPPAPPDSLHCTPAQHRTVQVVEDAADPKPERPRNFKRMYAERWRVIQVDPWKFATKPAVEEGLTQTEPVGPLLDTVSRRESHRRLSSAPPTSCRTPSNSFRRQGTPTEWSLSNRGSSVALKDAHDSASGDEQNNKLEILPAVVHPLSDTEKRATLDTVVFSDAYSPQPPTPAQRIKRSSLPPSSPFYSSPEPSARPPPHHVSRHDADAWKEPTFILRNRGKGKASTVEEPDTPITKVTKKRRRSIQPEPSTPKRVKVASAKDTEIASNGKTHSDNRPTFTTDATGMTPLSVALPLSRPRLANFVVDFERIDFGKRAPLPNLSLDPDLMRVLLTTGRIRTRGGVEEDGSDYIDS